MGCSCCGTGDKQKLTSEIKGVIEQTAFVPITTLTAQGKPHLIVAGKVKEIREDNTLVFGVYKMVQTRQNLADNGIMQVAVVSGKKGYRFSGKGCAVGDEVLFAVDSIETLL